MRRVLGTVNPENHPLPGHLGFLVHRHVESHVAVQPFPLPLLLPICHNRDHKENVAWIPAKHAFWSYNKQILIESHTQRLDLEVAF